MRKERSLNARAGERTGDRRKEEKRRKTRKRGQDATPARGMEYGEWERSEERKYERQEEQEGK